LAKPAAARRAAALLNLHPGRRVAIRMPILRAPQEAGDTWPQVWTALGGGAVPAGNRRLPLWATCARPGRIPVSWR